MFGESALAVVATIVLAITLTVAPRAIGVCVFLLAGEYLIHQRTDGASAATTIVFASGLLSLAQLSGWVSSGSNSARIERRVLTRRLATLAAVAVGGAIVAALALLGGSVAVESALVAAVVGSVGGCALLALVLIVQQLDLSAARAPVSDRSRGAGADRSRLHREKSGG